MLFLQSMYILVTYLPSWKFTLPLVSHLWSPTSCSLRTMGDRTSIRRLTGLSTPTTNLSNRPTSGYICDKDDITGYNQPRSSWALSNSLLPLSSVLTSYIHWTLWRQSRHLSDYLNSAASPASHIEGSKLRLFGLSTQKIASAFEKDLRLIQER